MTTIEAARVHTRIGWLGPSRVHLDGGSIAAIEPLPHDAAVPPVILVPGFVDLQVNGIDDVDVARAQGTDWSTLGRHLIAQGVTCWCPTLVTAPFDRYLAPLGRMSTAMTGGEDGVVAPQIVGAHLEGPFLGGAPGAHRREYLAEIDLDWLRSLPAHVVVVTLAPELDHAAEAIALLVERGVLVSLGHTTASHEEITAGIDAGARLATHLFNAMSGLHHRQPGVAASALLDERISASLIADGIHMHPRMLRIAFELLRDRAVLVTDAVAWRAGTAGAVGLEVHDGAPRLPDGTLAGSTLTMDRAIRVCVGAAGVDLHTAVCAASQRPAELLGLSNRGEIAVGKRADLVALDGDLEIDQVWIGGRLNEMRATDS